jgi:hypothetical protein
MRTRRNEVVHLLLRGSVAKLQAGMDERAARLIEKAYQLASRPVPLPGPWVSLAAYRLALLQLRTRSDRAGLESVLSWLEEADGAEFLGPWPAIYRLAALARLGVEPASLEEAFRDAGSRAEAHDRHHHAHVGGFLGPTAGGRAGALVEYFGLCAGLASDVAHRQRDLALIGSGEPYTWLCVGTTIGPKPLSLPRSLAVAEFEAYQTQEQAAEQLYFALPAQGTAWMSLAGGEPEPSHPQGLRLLTHLLNERPMPSERLRQLVLGPDASSAAWDKARSRLNKRLGAMLGRRGSTAILQDHQGQWVLSPTLSVLGLVDKAALDPAVRRRGSGGWKGNERPIGHVARDS